ncbi:alpha/beta fold hydrolase [Pseudoalteromonas piscicida]|uniref:alpha/beta fold hydrolase n=1 Tax=Pseudoalteromonas piscicida TaxID=43662 RepID=UPI000E35C9FA|nr:alpha/beta hydrolase [Pseudoalteromonas piscicida]AXQ97206.1 alpha/beta hydrolase [Pseudoalteromonas piscicida]
MTDIKIATGINIHYQDEGAPHAPVIILIMGLGAQMTIWPDELYFGLVNKGFRVIRFDNRDTGLSSHLDHLGSPSVIKTMLSKKLPIRASVPYTLEDMAGDVVALMAGLKIKRAHLVGASMGGMIAQIVAAKHKKKVVSLTSIMSTSAYPKFTAANVKVMLQLAKARPKSDCHQSAIQYNIKLNQLIGSPAYPQDEGTLHQQAKHSIERAHNPQGFKRQLAAIVASQCRKHTLAKIKTPTLVIHGTDDPIFPAAAGQQTAATIRKSKLKLVNGMGHDFPPMLMQKIAKWVAKHVTKAERKRLQKKQRKQNAAQETANKKIPKNQSNTLQPNSDNNK